MSYEKEHDLPLWGANKETIKPFESTLENLSALVFRATWEETVSRKRIPWDLLRSALTLAGIGAGTAVIEKARQTPVMVYAAGVIATSGEIILKTPNNAVNLLRKTVKK